MSATTRAMPPVTKPATRLALTVVEGEDAGASIVVDGPILVGTSEHANLVLTDRTVSRRHLRVMPAALGLRVEDQDSMNGSWLGEQRLYDAELKVGAEIRIGNTRLVVEVAAGERPATARGVERDSTRTSFGRFVGAAPSLAPLYAALERVAKTDTTVLIEGESGTGKELLAEALHENSHRKDGPFVVVDCGAVPETLVESELFGHVRGAFTGADRDRAGAFEQAHKGTIFIDEIGELPLALQTRLLRALDRRHVRRLGSDKQIDVDVRVLAATNRNLEREVEASRFRLDLFHRLAVVLLRVPPLRERPSDIPLLARHLLRALGGDESILTEAIVERLVRHDWPGNVRELRNHVERLHVLGESLDERRASAERPPAGGAFDAAARSGLPYRKARAMILEAFTDAYVEDMLARHAGNVSHAAEAAGVARRHFQRLKSE